MPRHKKYKKRKTIQDLNGCELKAGQQRKTPGQFTGHDYSAEKGLQLYRHPDLQPVTLTALIDAFRLNGVAFTHELDGQYECTVEAAGIKREINPYDGAEVLAFFREVVCQR